jgi:PEP-CTERM motif
MKKYLSVLAAAAMAAYATSAFAQGTVNFNNGTGLVQQWTDANNSTLISVPKGGGSVQLFWAPAGSAYTPWTGGMSEAAFLAANPLWKQETATLMNAPVAGKFLGGVRTLSPLTPAGSGIDYVVMGWTGAAASFDAALAANGMVNVSGKFSSATGNPSAVPAGTPVALSTTFGGITLQPVPEPSTLALAGLGAAALLIFRRRK